jgi:response regulator RpfG family c-di-GMP phosphodiesterase
VLTKVKARYPQAIRMLFTGFADLESVIAAINQVHIFQFVRKPWQPEELQMAVRKAASECDRLETIARDREQLLEEIDGLKNRLFALESEVRRLHHLPKNPSRPPQVPEATG